MPAAQPFGVTDLLLLLLDFLMRPRYQSSRNHSQWWGVKNFVEDRLSEAVASWVQKIARDCRASLLRRDRRRYSLPTGCRGSARTRPNFRIMGPRPSNRATIWARTFSGMRKSAAFPFYRLTAAFPGFASDQLAEAFRGHSLVCPANGSSPLLAYRTSGL